MLPARQWLKALTGFTSWAAHNTCYLTYDLF
ncbi:hypothetical protein APT_01527 [Acetobacter pasteurianus NBRC 101655]|nr:hypothetical protein APT_01527 [Acetobacter pasteurianus NBRC 101655]